MSKSQTAQTADKDWYAIREVHDHEIGTLPVRLRIPLNLFHLEGRELKEVASELNTTVSTVGTVQTKELIWTASLTIELGDESVAAAVLLCQWSQRIGSRLLIPASLLRQLCVKISALGRQPLFRIVAFDCTGTCQWHTKSRILR